MGSQSFKEIPKLRRDHCEQVFLRRRESGEK